MVMRVISRTDLLMNEAWDFLDEHGLTEWKVEWDRAKNRLGCCHFKTKTISFSLPLMEVNDDNTFRDTLKHEVAHALVGFSNGHNYIWKWKCAQLGGNPERTTAVENKPQAKYTGTCPNGHKAERNRLTQNAHLSSCVKCSPYYNAAYRFTWATNY